MVKETGIQLLIWDWNGTLLDDTALCYGIANGMRKARGMPPLPSLTEYRRLFGFPVIDYYRRMGYTFETESYEEISVEFVATYAERVPSCPLQAGAVETLSAVRRMGVSQVLLSATGADRLADQAAMFDLPRFFDEIIGAENNLAHGKAEQARALIARKGLSPDEVLFIGDTDHDFEVSRDVGCRCALLTSGHQLPEHLARLGAPLLARLSEVPELLKNGERGLL